MLNKQQKITFPNHFYVGIILSKWLISINPSYYNQHLFNCLLTREENKCSHKHRKRPVSFAFLCVILYCYGPLLYTLLCWGYLVVQYSKAKLNIMSFGPIKKKKKSIPFLSHNDSFSFVSKTYVTSCEICRLRCVFTLSCSRLPKLCCMYVHERNALILMLLQMCIPLGNCISIFNSCFMFAIQQ